MEPDYSKYTQEELLNVYESIDREMYPERFKALCNYIELKKPVEKKEEIIDQPKKLKGSWLACLIFGLYFFLHGCYSIYTGEYNGLKNVHHSLEDDPGWFKFSVGLQIVMGLYLLLHFYRLRYNKPNQQDK